MNQLLPKIAGGSVNYTWDSIKVLLGNVTQIALAAAGFIAAIYLIIGAIQYFTAYGDEAKATAAKNTITYAIIGIIIIVIGRVIVGWAWHFVTPVPLTF